MRNIGSGSATPVNVAQRPTVSRNASGGTAVPQDVVNSMHSPANSGKTAEQPGRHRLSSLPVASTADQEDVVADPSPEEDRSPSPGPAESSSTTSSEDASSPVQSRIIRRPPRFQSQDTAGAYADDEDDDDESEPAFQPYKPPSGSGQTSAHDLSSTLRGDGSARANTSRRTVRAPVRDQRGHQSQTSDSDTSSAMQASRGPRPHRAAGPLSPRRTAELAGVSSGGKGSREGSDGTPSMGSSFSDLDGMLTHHAWTLPVARHPPSNSFLLQTHL